MSNFSDHIKKLAPALCVIKQLKNHYNLRIDRIRAQGKTKYFCIGRNKTGTTSLRQAFLDLGYPVGDQQTAERLADSHYFDGNFAPINAYCQSAQVFQDVPFSWPETFKHVDQAFPGSKFILTIRDDAEQWYRSITRFHAKHFGDGRIPTAELLRKSNYVCKGFMYRALKLQGGTDADIYNKDALVAHYQRHNQSVLDYFKNRPNDLLVINLSDPDSYQKFVAFLGIDSPFSFFPWENRT